MPSDTPAAQLEGLSALICGASRGIGRATANQLAMMGASVTLLARDESALARACDETRRLGAPQAEFVVADMDDRPALAARLSEHIQQRGPFQILVNNTGGPPPGPLVDAEEQDFLVAFGRHLLCAHLLTRMLLPGMLASGYGRIVNIISLSVREPIHNLGVSNSIRAAVAAWGKSLAGELPPKITANNVLPGYTDTERLRSLAKALAESSGSTAEAIRRQWTAAIPEGRLGQAEEIAALVGFLASPAASYLRGQSIAVDGGRLRCM